MEIAVGGGGGERLYSQNLRDFLRIKEEDHRRNLNQSTPSSSDGGRRSSSGLTLSAVLSEKIGQPPPVEEPLRRVESNRTLLDIIREDQTAGLGRGREDGRRSWRHLKDKIRLRRRGGFPIPSPDVNDSNHHHPAATRHHSIRFNSNTDSGESSQPDSRAPIPLWNPRRSTESASARFEPVSSTPRRRSVNDDNLQNGNGNGNGNENEERRSEAVEAEGDGSSPEQPVRMSLMALLAETDRQMGFETSAYVMDEDEAEKEVKAETASSSAVCGGGGNGVEYNYCCVCMVRHKGAAFIPCGHTFCRLCCRELWVQRGNCPLCNNFILEILDIF
ncbi:hypothetical protein C2S53_010734 [Perilla frutescens var. hirtella]|uniref:RING-type domain-containing protein n=1 Tax=Perilla frutescens var. hirtella TaxID=608512 RepID=A0AAD4J9U1_PERFH|nr:hypothetical protein C2S53_010734 [Perilla frutescens var. hirtella]